MLIWKFGSKIIFFFWDLKKNSKQKFKFETQFFFLFKITKKFTKFSKIPKIIKFIPKFQKINLTKCFQFSEAYQRQNEHYPEK